MKSIKGSPNGSVAIFLVALLMMSILTGLFISHWVMVQNRGDMRSRVAVRENILAMNAIQDARLRFIQGAYGPCVAGTPQTTTYNWGDGTTVTITMDCQSFP